VKDFNNDGELEAIVLYFNKVIQIYNLEKSKDYHFIAELKMPDLLNIPFKMYTLSKN